MSSGKTDEAKGKAKKVAGELVDDEELKREGEGDKLKGKAKQNIDKASKNIKEALD